MPARIVVQPAVFVGFLGARWRPFGVPVVIEALRALSSLVRTLGGSDGSPLLSASKVGQRRLSDRMRLLPAARIDPPT